MVQEENDEQKFNPRSMAKGIAICEMVLMTSLLAMSVYILLQFDAIAECFPNEMSEKSRNSLNTICYMLASYAALQFVASALLLVSTRTGKILYVAPWYFTLLICIIMSILLCSFAVRFFQQIEMEAYSYWTIVITVLGLALKFYTTSLIDTYKNTLLKESIVYS